MKQPPGRSLHAVPVLIGFGIVSPAVCWTVRTSTSSAGAGAVFLGALAGLTVAGVLTATRSGPKELEITEFATAAGLEDMPALIDLLWAPGGTVREDVGRSLARLLPRLSAAELAHLSRHRRALLARVIAGAGRFGDDRLSADLTAAVLRVIDSSDGRSINRRVQRLAAGTAASPDERTVREAARRCLDRQLLSAVQSPDRETLIRVAEPSSDGNEEFLLRPPAGIRE